MRQKGDESERMQATRLFQEPTQQPVLPKSIRVMEREGGKVGAEGGVKGHVEGTHLFDRIPEKGGRERGCVIIQI